MGPGSPATCGGSARTVYRSPAPPAAVPMALAHTLELNAGTLDTETGPQLQANWTWAPSALDDAQVTRLSQLWFEALTGICAHVQSRWGRAEPVRHRAGAAEPAADRRVAAATPDRRHLAVDPAAAGTALSRQNRAGRRRHVCGATGFHRHRRRRPAPACAMRCTPWSTGIPTWWPDSANSSTSRCRSSRPIRRRRGGMWTPTALK